MTSEQRPPPDFPAEGIGDDAVRLRLRTEADLTAVVEACRDPAIKNYARVPDDYEIDVAAQKAEAAEERRLAGEELSLLIVDPADDALLGYLVMFDYDLRDSLCEVGYWLAPWARGKGLMDPALRLFCGWIFDELPVERMTAGIEPDNAPSIALIERLGFRREGILRSAFEHQGRRRDVVSYSLLRGEL